MCDLYVCISEYLECVEGRYKYNYICVIFLSDIFFGFWLVEVYFFVVFDRLYVNLLFV